MPASSAKANTTSPTTDAITNRNVVPERVERCSKRSGRLRSTSTNSTVKSDSTATVVSARSGAPWITNSAAML